MRKVVLGSALAIFLFSCNGTQQNHEGGATTAAPEATSAPASIVGAWQVVDLVLHTTEPLNISHEQMQAGILQDSMKFTFLADGTIRNTAKSLDPSEGRYMQHGDSLEMSSANGNRKVFRIMKLTASNLSILTVEGKDTTTFIMERRQ